MTSSNPKPLLILDLDETLIHATTKALEIQPDMILGPYNIYRRPFLSQFIDEISTQFELAVWSSSSQGYVDAIVHHVFPKQPPLAFHWARNRCVARYDPDW